MPTGYTMDIYDGKNISFRNFMLKCARAWGACILLRDQPIDDNDPIPDDVRPISSYHTDALEESLNKLNIILKWTEQEAQTAADAEYAELYKDYEKKVKENQDLEHRYKTMLDKVYNWNPPTKDHESFKEFVKNQLLQSLKFDVYNTMEPPKILSGKEYKSKKISILLENIKYHHQHYNEEVEISLESNKWVKDLKDSLPSQAI